MQSVNMTESRLDREQKRLATDMNVPAVDENLYVYHYKIETYLKLNLLLLTMRIAKQSNLTPNLVLLTVRIAKQSNPILGLVNLPSKIARQ